MFCRCGIKHAVADIITCSAVAFGSQVLKKEYSEKRSLDACCLSSSVAFYFAALGS
jgi:hypothetical protein